jgi:hypothetical protein
MNRKQILNYNNRVSRAHEKIGQQREKHRQSIFSTLKSNFFNYFVVVVFFSPIFCGKLLVDDIDLNRIKEILAFCSMTYNYIFGLKSFFC